MATEAQTLPPLPHTTPVVVPRLTLALIGFGFAPLVLVFFANLWGRPHYQFFPMALAGVGHLAWSRLAEAERPFERGHSLVTALFGSLSAGLLLVGTALWSPWLGFFALLFATATGAWWTGGWHLLRTLLPAFFLTLTIIPPPLGLDNRLILELRGIAVRSSSHLLDILGVVHLLSGNIIELPRQKLLVEEACSGINSVLLSLSACTFYLLWRRRSVWRFLVCLPLVISWVVLGNIIRITLGAWLKANYNIDTLSGWPHEIVGLILVATYMALILSLDQLLDFLTHPLIKPQRLAVAESLRTEDVDQKSDHGGQITEVRGQGAEMTDQDAVPGLRNSAPNLQPLPLALRLTAFACLAFGIAQLGIAYLRHDRATRWTLASKSSLKPNASFTMPERVGVWQRLSADAPFTHKIETLGIYSQIWNYRKGETVASVALDYPFRGYHDVTVCYRNAGWIISHNRCVSGEPPMQQAPFCEAEMSCYGFTHGSLWFGTVDEQGRWLDPRAVTMTTSDRWKLRAIDAPTTYRVQVLVSSLSPPPPGEAQEARQLFEQARVLLAEQLRRQFGLVQAGPPSAR
jgi:exosortase